MVAAATRARGRPQRCAAAAPVVTASPDTAAVDASRRRPRWRSSVAIIAAAATAKPAAPTRPAVRIDPRRITRPATAAFPPSPPLPGRDPRPLREHVVVVGLDHFEDAA